MRVALHWFRRDLRLQDNTALHAASRAADLVVPLFVLDDHLLKARSIGAPRVAFLLDSLHRLAADLGRRGCPLVVRRGVPERAVVEVARDVGAEAVFVNEDYSPYARRRDAAVRTAAAVAGIAWHSYEDLLLVSPGDCVKDNGEPYSVFTPFARRWRARAKTSPLPAPPLVALPAGIRSAAGGERPPAAAALGFTLTARIEPGGEVRAHERLGRFVERHLPSYRSTRDRPDLDATSHLSSHLKFGTISVRTVYAAAATAIGDELASLDPGAPGRRLAPGAAARLREGGAFLEELCWRDFYYSVLTHFPYVVQRPFRRSFVGMDWPERSSALIEAWREGRTGFPIVDAAMRQLAATGWMHNRLRMVVAMFLSKTLLVDYRVGERVFMQRLVDADLAANNGGWQWSASTGTDAAPYFRIFNPLSQARRFDPDGAFVRRFVPELRRVAAPLVHQPALDPELLARTGYPRPCVDYVERRARALELLSQRERRAARSRWGRDP
jgi:deoxyribodipyrimidine photo-lyase